MIILPEDKVVMSLLSPEDGYQVLLALFSEDGDMPALSTAASVAYTVIRMKSDRISKSKSAAGKRSAEKRAEALKLDEAEQGATGGSERQREVATVSETETVSEAKEIPPTPSRGRRGVAGVPLFDEFWAAYPKKQAKQDAIKAWQKLKPDKALLEVLLKALSGAKQAEAWTKDGGRYIPLPATWLRGRRWEDEVDIDVEAQDDAEEYRWIPPPGYEDPPAG